MEKSNSAKPADNATTQNSGSNASVYIKLSNSWRNWRVSLLSGLAMVFIPLGLYLCADLNGCFEFKYPTSVVDQKTSVVNGNSEFDVTIKLEMWNGGSLRNCADEMKEIVKHELKEGKQEKSIVFRVVGDVESGGGYDRYGNPIPTSTATFNALNIQFSMDDLRKVNWDHMSSLELLNLGSVTRFGSYGDSAARNYCEMARDYSRDFCANF